MKVYQIDDLPQSSNIFPLQATAPLRTFPLHFKENGQKDQEVIGHSGRRCSYFSENECIPCHGPDKVGLRAE